MIFLLSSVTLLVVWLFFIVYHAVFDNTLIYDDTMIYMLVTFGFILLLFVLTIVLLIIHLVVGPLGIFGGIL